jgi:hypothetical protein
MRLKAGQADTLDGSYSLYDFPLGHRLHVPYSAGGGVAGLWGMPEEETCDGSLQV